MFLDGGGVFLENKYSNNSAFYSLDVTDSLLMLGLS